MRYWEIILGEAKPIQPTKPTKPLNPDQARARAKKITVQLDKINDIQAKNNIELNAAKR